MSPSTGIIFNNEMADFSIPDQESIYGIPPLKNNFIEPCKRPISSMSPTIFTDVDSNFVFGVGCAGGTKIFPATAYVRERSFDIIWFTNGFKSILERGG